MKRKKMCRGVDCNKRTQIDLLLCMADGCKIKEKKENSALLYKCIGEMLQLAYWYI